MRTPRLTNYEAMCPTEFIEIHGPSLEEEQMAKTASYHELKDDVNFTFHVEDGVALLVLYAYVIYHLISKLRGNEKNLHMNNFGIALALLMFVYYSVWFIDDATFTLMDSATWEKWYDHHETLYYWIYWSADSAYLLYHWLFNWRYVKSTFRLPVLQKVAEFHNEMLDQIIKQREEQHVIFSPQKLEDHEREMI